jgi:hypothetical protein
MAFHHDLLDVARSMIPPHLPPYPPAPAPAFLRRGVSTAYYAVFHLLVYETMARIIADPTLREDIGRLIGHEQTKSVCKEYAEAQADPAGMMKLKSGSAIPPQLQSIGSGFVTLIEARHSVDYDSKAAKNPTHAEAFTYLMTAEDAFLDWVAVQGDPATGAMLTKIFMASLARRKL